MILTSATTAVQFCPVLIGEPYSQGSGALVNPSVTPSLTIDRNNANAPLPAALEITTNRTGVLLARLSNEFITDHRGLILNRPSMFWYNVDEQECQASGGPDVGIVQFESVEAVYVDGGGTPVPPVSTGTAHRNAHLMAGTLRTGGTPIPLSMGSPPTVGLIPFLEVRNKRSGVFFPRLPDAYITSIYSYLIYPECAGLFWFNTTVGAYQFSTGEVVKTLSHEPS